MNKIQNNRASNIQTTVANTTLQTNQDAGAVPLGNPEEKAAAFERAPAKRASIFAANAGGDSRVVSPAGGGTGQVNNQEAIDGHSTKEGDFTEPRTVGGKSLFFTLEGAKAVDAMLARAEPSSAPVRAESDPSLWERFLLGDPFAGLEQHTGKTK